MADSATINRASPRSGGFWPGSALAALVIVFCLSAAEFVLRHWFPAEVLIQRDTRYLYKLIPNSRAIELPVAGSGAKRVLITINSQGRRGDLVSEGRGYRVMVYGDSFIAAMGTPLDQTFVRQLGKMLQATTAEPVQAINAGVVGYGPDQESLVMEDEIDKVKPNLIIVALCSLNDYGDLIRNKLYRLDQSGQLISGNPKLDASINDTFERAEKLAKKFRVLRLAQSGLTRLRSSERVQAIKAFLHVGRPTIPHSPVDGTKRLTAWLSIRRKEYQENILQHDDMVHNLLSDTYDADVSLTPNSESARYKIALMERVMERIQRIAASRSVPLIFLIIPAAIDVEDKRVVSVDPSAFPEYQRSRLTDNLERIAREHQFSYLNLYEPFRARRGDHMYFRGADDHWNATGEKFAADLLTDYIERNHLLRQQPVAALR